MSKFASILAFVLLLGTSFAPAVATERVEPGPTAVVPAATKNGHMTINGVGYYYEVRGKGEPLLMLHGGLGSIEMFGPALAQFADTRQVIAVDLQGHGRTLLGDRPFRLESMGDDMAVLVKQLGHDKVDVLGYSIGGGVAFRMAVQHPERVRRLVLVSTPFSDSGWYPAIHAQQVMLTAEMAPMMQDTPMYKSYAALAPKVEDFPRLLGVLGDFMRQHYDWSSDVAKLTMPVMLVYGDGDMLQPEHEIKFYQLLGGGLRDAGWQRETLSKNRLAILPDLTHYDIFASPRVATTALPFLDGKSDTRSWAEQVDNAK